MTQKEFRNLFDSIECSEEFAERMETLLSEPLAVTGFAETASGVSITKKRTQWVRYAGIAACLLLVTGGAVFFLHQERMPSEHPVSSEQETTASTTASAESSTVTTIGTKVQTEHVIVTQTLAQTSAGTSSETPETVTETTAPPQTEAEALVMSDPTMPPETDAPTKAPTEPETSTELETTPETTTTMEPIVIPELVFDMSMFPMQDLTALSEEELLTAGYYYFYAAEALDAALMICPYDYDYMNTQGRAIEQDGTLWLPVTDASVQSTADVQEDFYCIFTSDKDSSHLSKYFMDTEDGLFCTDSTDSGNPYLEGYYLTLDSATEEEITYTCHVRIMGMESTNKFSLVREEAGWKVNRFYAPDMIQTLVLPGPEYFE